MCLGLFSSFSHFYRTVWWASVSLEGFVYQCWENLKSFFSCQVSGESSTVSRNGRYLCVVFILLWPYLLIFHLWSLMIRCLETWLSVNWLVTFESPWISVKTISIPYLRYGECFFIIIRVKLLHLLAFSGRCWISLIQVFFITTVYKVLYAFFICLHFFFTFQYCYTFKETFYDQFSSLIYLLLPFSSI